MKETLKEIFLMGIGAVSMTGEKASELKKELLEKGKAAYNEGTIKNEELKREIKEKVKENTNIQYSKVTEDDIVDIINNLSDEEKARITELLKNKTDENKSEEKKSHKKEIKIEDEDVENTDENK